MGYVDCESGRLPLTPSQTVESSWTAAAQAAWLLASRCGRPNSIYT
jgi:hypothetical protein